MENQIDIYTSPDGHTHIETKFEDETVWLTQKMMADLFQTTVPNINMHLKNVFDNGELTEEATIKDFLIVRLEGKREVKRSQKYYNLDAVINNLANSYPWRSSCAKQNGQEENQYNSPNIQTGILSPYPTSSPSAAT